MSLFRRSPRGPHTAATVSDPPNWWSIIRCPQCHGALDVDEQATTSQMRCAEGHVWPIVDGVPVFTADGRNVARRPTDHQSHQPNPALLANFTDPARPWLHLGAGATAQRIPGSIELETAVFIHTDVVGDVHHLPFADGSLGGVLALNVFEHLERPEIAARELHRCLAPGSPIVIQTAFLQPLHSDPYHFYGATEAGVRRWFEQFTDLEVTVPGNFNPVYALSWMSSDLLHHAPEHADTLGSLTLRELADFWRDPSSQHGAAWDAFMHLGDTPMRALAAGFQVVARRPSVPNTRDQGAASS